MKTNKMYVTKILLLIIFPLFFVQCDKNNIKKCFRYTRCTIAGKEYRNSEHVLPIFRSPYPMVSYGYDGKKRMFTLFTDCVPKEINEVSKTSILGLEFVIFLNDPLKINTKYQVESLPNKKYLMPEGTDKEYYKANISYSSLNIFNTMKDYSYGDGFVEFTSIDFDNDILEGIFELEFPFSMQKSENIQTIEIQGEFRGNYPR